MSDDTPTQKFESPGADAPTEVIGGPPTPPAGTAAPTVAGEGKSRRLMIILISIGGALLIILILLLILLLTRGPAEPTPVPTPSDSVSTSPSPSPTPTPTPTPPPTSTPTPTPTNDPPPSNALKINSFTGTDTIFCNSEAPVTPDYTLSFSWSTSNASQVYFGVATNDASQGALFDNLPASGNSQDDFDFDVTFPCPAESQFFTLTIVGNGNTISKTITVQNEGDTQ